MSANNISVVSLVHELYAKKDLEAATALVSDQFEWTVVAFGMTVQGQDGFRQGFNSFAVPFPDSRLNYKNVIANGESVVVEFDFVGTHNGPLMTPAGEVPPSGRAVTLPGIEVFRVQDEKVVSIHTYFDSTTLMQQIGLLVA